MEEFKPKDLFIIQDLETLRAVADPLKVQIYETMLLEPVNVRQVAERLGLAPTRLYYHINQMEKLGLIRVVETRMVANMVEKIYRAVAYQIDVAPGLLNFETDESTQAVMDMLVGGIDATREDLLRSLNARLFNLDQGAPKKERPVMVSRVTAVIPDEKARAFRDRLEALVAEFTEADIPPGQRDEAAQNYALLVALYPSFYYGEQGEPKEQGS